MEKLLVEVLALVRRVVLFLFLFVLVLVFVRVGNDFDRLFCGCSRGRSVRVASRVSGVSCVFSASDRADVVDLYVLVAVVVKAGHNVVIVAVVAEKHERILLFEIEFGVAVDRRLVYRLAVSVEKRRGVGGLSRGVAA